MDRELLIEIGCEEIPASWLPALTSQVARHLEARLKEFRLAPDGQVESFSTPRRLTARVAKLAERQTDLEDRVTGPPLSAAFKPDGEPTPAAVGFAKKYGVEVSALERHETPKGTYLSYRVHQRGKAAVDVLADVTAGLLRDMTFPKQMRWDAYLEDGKDELVFARPIRWIVLLYGGRVVPFVIRRAENAQGPLVQDVRSGANTYGHRFLTTSGRAGRAIKVKTFEDYQARLAENFVILDRSEREGRIRRELETHARRLGGRVGAVAGTSLLQEVPDLVEYPSVVAGHFPAEFLDLPEEVLTTTMIHHQHYFPVVDEEGRLKPAFLAVINMQPEKPEIISRNSERVLTARLRDARFFYDDDRKVPLAARVERLSTILFHKKLGSYREKAERVAALASWIASEAFARPEAAAAAEKAGRLAKADLATDMVRELTELQGTMGGIYARAEGEPEAVWKAIYFHYLPIGVEAEAPPSRAQLGAAAIPWAAVSIADKVDSVVGLIGVNERPTGSRDPLGLRRQAQGIVRILTDLHSLTGLEVRPPLEPILKRARYLLNQPEPDETQRLFIEDFFVDRIRHLMTVRGLDYEEKQATTGHQIRALTVNHADLLERAIALRESKVSPEFSKLAETFKRANNIVEHEWAGRPASERRWGMHQEALTEEAERRLRHALDDVGQHAQQALQSHDPRSALNLFATLQPALERFFLEVRVVVPDETLKEARLSLLAELRDRILELGDISVMAPQPS